MRKQQKLLDSDKLNEENVTDVVTETDVGLFYLESLVKQDLTSLNGIIELPWEDLEEEATSLENSLEQRS